MQLPILDAIPDATEFYEQYWARQPFVVRACVPKATIESLISPDELAALSCEDSVRARMVGHDPEGGAWTTQHGPFLEVDFESVPDAHWSLLVQNVEQSHLATASLLPHFNFSPRWLLDDIMVSYATSGGTVGPHVDSYHVFLVQGQGSRRWRIAQTLLPVSQEKNIEGVELKVLQDSFVGTEVLVSCGDMIYLPPRFAHEGVAMEPSMTYSVGFLGPKVSELLMGFGAYLHDNEALDQFYTASGLDSDDQNFEISDSTLNDLRRHMEGGVLDEPFALWVAEFFSGCSNEEISDLIERESPLSAGDMHEHLKSGERLIKPPHVKLAIVRSTSMGTYLGVGGETRFIDTEYQHLLDHFASEQPFSVDVGSLDETGLTLVTDFFNLRVLVFLTEITNPEE